MAAAAACALRYPGVALLWAAVIAAAWAEPAVELTGKKDSSGYPTPANPGEAAKLRRFRMWRDLKFRMILPNADWMPGWPVLASWLFAASAAGLIWFAPVRMPAFRIVNSAAMLIVVAQLCASMRRRTAEDCPGARVDSLVDLARSPYRWVVLAGGVILAGVADAAVWFFAPAGLVPHQRLALIPISALCLLAAAIGPWKTLALAEWRALTNARAEWKPRWEALKIDPVPDLVEHEALGQLTVDTFMAPGHMGAMAFWPMAPKIAPLLGGGMRIAVLETPDEGPSGPVPGTRHPLQFKVVTLATADAPDLSDGALEPEVVEIYAHCCFVWAVEPLGYGRPVPLGVEKITVDPPPTPNDGPGAPEARPEPVPEANEDNEPVAPEINPETGLLMSVNAGPTRAERRAAAKKAKRPPPPQPGPPAVYASQWSWPGGPDLATIRKDIGAEAVSESFGVEVLLDHRKDVVYFGALTDDPDVYVDGEAVPVRLDQLREEDKWTGVWKSVLKQGVNAPTLHHDTVSVMPLADGTPVTRMGFAVLLGEDPLSYQRLEPKIATALSGAAFTAVTGWPGRGQRSGERHPQAFGLVFSKTPVPQTPDAIEESTKTRKGDSAAQWVLAGRINEAFDKCRLPRPEVASARCLSDDAASRPGGPRGRAMRRPGERAGSRQRRPGTGNVWEVQLRLYGGVTLANVRQASERLRQALGAPWLRVAEADDGCVVFMGATPAKAALSDPEADGPRLRALDWEQAFLDNKIVGAGGLLPKLVADNIMPNNPAVHVLTFALPSGLDISMLREASRKLCTSTGNEYVEARKSDQGPKVVNILTCEHNPMPAMVPYPFDREIQAGEIAFATAIDGEPVSWNPKGAPHMLFAGVTGSGKSSAAQTILYGALAAGCELYVIDPTKGASDFTFLKPYAKAIVGLDAEKDLAFHLIDAAATMKAVYAEGLRRRKLNVAHGVGSYLDLPEDVRPKTVVVFIDEFVGLIGMDKVPKQPFDDEDMEHERQVQLATNMAKATVGQMSSKIAAEARAWGIHLILGTQKLPAAMLDNIPGGSTLKANLARMLLGKCTPGDRMSALRVPEEYPDMGDAIGKGRGVWEPLDDSMKMIQTWFATQSDYSEALSTRVQPLSADEFLDASEFRLELPEKDETHDFGFAGFDAEPEASPADETVIESELSFSLDELEVSLDDLDSAASEDGGPEARDAAGQRGGGGDLDWGSVDAGDSSARGDAEQEQAERAEPDPLIDIGDLTEDTDGIAQPGATALFDDFDSVLESSEDDAESSTQADDAADDDPFEAFGATEQPVPPESPAPAPAVDPASEPDPPADPDDPFATPAPRRARRRKRADEDPFA